MREETEKLLRGAGFHRPHFVWFSPAKRKSRKSGHISSLSLDQLLETKIAIRTAPWTRWHGYGRDDEESYASREQASRNVTTTPLSQRKKTIERVVSETTSYETPRAKVVKSNRPTCNRCPHPGQKCSFQGYTIPKPKPPIPPRRSSSLPREARVVEVITRPFAPLALFSLTEQDGHIFQYLLFGPLSGITYFSRSGLWPIVLQRCHTEPCIRHVSLATAMIHQLRTKTNRSQARELYRCAFQHYAKAVRLLHRLLTTRKRAFDSELWETALLATFLFGTFETMRRNDESARWWMQRGTMLLRRACNQRGSSSHLPSGLEGFELVFMDLDLSLRFKRRRAKHRNERNMGKCTTSVSNRRQRLLERRRPTGEPLGQASTAK